MGESVRTTKILVDSIGSFNGLQGRYEGWVAKTTSAFDLYSPAISEIINGKTRPVDLYAAVDGSDSRSIADHSAGTDNFSTPAPSARRGVAGTSPVASSGSTSGTPQGRTETRTQRAERLKKAAEAAAAAALAAAEDAETDGDQIVQVEVASRDSTVLLQEQQDWDRANVTLYHVLFLCTTGAAASLVKKFKPRPGAAGDGIAVWSALKNKYQPNDEQHRRALITELNHISMKSSTDPDIFITDVWDLVHKLEDMGEPVSESRIADIILHGLPAEYDPLRLQADIDPEFDLSKIEHTARSMYISRRRAAGTHDRQERHQHSLRDSGMVATAVRPGSAQVSCWGCGAEGHRRSECPLKHQNSNTSGAGSHTRNNKHRGRRSSQNSSNPSSRGQSRPREVKWCQLHNTHLHSNEECRAQHAGATGRHYDHNCASTTNVSW